MTPVPETRPSLLIQLRDAQNQQAWGEFLKIYQPLIHRLACRRGLQDADAREVTQEVLVAVAGAIGRWEQGSRSGSFRRWLTTITRNLVINFLIHQSKQPRPASDRDLSEWMRESPAPTSDVTIDFEWEEKQQIFRIAAERIRSEFQASTWLAFWKTTVDECPIPSVASELNVSPGMVYVSRSRVMKRLREKVREIQVSYENENKSV